ncbi:MAG TPA: hypothetical protein DGG94_06305 [Micromonosporaceae bacterium]|nr:hypothetical protein [Micromonosporaceae bacterium]HCU49405.1 hypothetical protein [Micromonosporaceae bacterium]
MDPLGMITAMDAVNQHLKSAQPGAPVVPDGLEDRQVRPARAGLLRHNAATVLRRMAERIEPACSNPAGAG